jgi:uncharacterized protein (TIRG00374 family)
MEILEQHKQANLLTKIIFIILSLIVILIVVLDFNKLKSLLLNANLSFLGVALIFTLLSIFFNSLGLFIANNIFGLKFKKNKFFKTAFVTIAFNNLILSGGIAGYSVRVLFLKNNNASGKDILSASLFHSYVAQVIVFSFLPFSFIYLLYAENVSHYTQIILTIALIISFIIFFLLSHLLFCENARKKILNFINKISIKIIKKNFDSIFNDFNITLTKGISLAKNQKKLLPFLLLMVFCEWMCCLTALWFCFKSFGIILNLGVLVAGFFIGIIAGYASIIPGGIGVQEASMSGVFSMLGVPFEDAIIASLLFRFVFYITPFLCGFMLYWKMMEDMKKEIPKAIKEIKN